MKGVCLLPWPPQELSEKALSNPALSSPQLSLLVKSYNLAFLLLAD